MAVYSKGPKAKKRQKRTRNKIIIGILFCIIVLAIIYLVVSDSLLDLKPYKEAKLIGSATEGQDNQQDKQNVEERKDEIVSDVTIPGKIGGYEVAGRLIISKIGVNSDILNDYSDPALEVSIGKISGPELNAPGNFCIVGHRGYQFEKLHTLKNGDTFYTINRKTKTKVTYAVSSVFTCGPNDVDCYRQNSDGKREITIVTCTPSGAQRVVCKAREI